MPLRLADDIESETPISAQQVISVELSFLNNFLLVVQKFPLCCQFMYKQNLSVSDSCTKHLVQPGTKI
jgi:hypothetical protein